MNALEAIRVLGSRHSERRPRSRAESRLSAKPVLSAAIAAAEGESGVGPTPMRGSHASIAARGADFRTQPSGLRDKILLVGD